LSSEQKLERVLTHLAKKDIAANTQNQAFSATLFFYQEALHADLKNVQALRAGRPAQIRRAPTPADAWQLVLPDASLARITASYSVRHFTERKARLSASTGGMLRSFCMTAQLMAQKNY